MNNKVFFQHPDLIGMLRIHENVMTVMMNTIGKSQNVPEADRQGVQQDTQKVRIAIFLKFAGCVKI